ncbi:hypothetical protein E2C01_009955 [Portunus trituberculatus]|uniref:Uncharacterized protein n=1 Tax=Portunus trituberculatus TaxID=210409 RepID=A0A5B7D754_PORTR|nr:hypothetical protein [Portunus trituberculatus]
MPRLMSERCVIIYRNVPSPEWRRLLCGLPFSLSVQGGSGRRSGAWEVLLTPQPQSCASCEALGTETLYSLINLEQHTMFHYRPAAECAGFHAPPHMHGAGSGVAWRGRATHARSRREGID